MLVQESAAWLVAYGLRNRTGLSPRYVPRYGLTQSVYEARGGACLDELGIRDVVVLPVPGWFRYLDT